MGAQVQGRITGFGKDKAGNPVDNNSEVDEGMVLALIDPSVYQSQVDQTSAQLKSSQAGVERAQADLGQFTAKFQQAERDWNRAQKLGPSDALAQVDYDSYQSAYETSKANVAVGVAEVDQAKASVSQAEATLKQAQQNLGYCTITAPVKGVVITRRVNIGQTVVSSLSSPSLFLIAKDLTRMQLWTAVNEADIGSIKEGQPVTFTVDAYPNRTFKGTVTKARLDAQMTQNVVTYTVEITCENADKALRPYMTANVSFQVAKKDNALLVPNVALRWSPTDPQMIAPDVRDAVVAEMSAGGGKGGGRQGGASAGASGGASGAPPATQDAGATSKPSHHGGGSGGADHQHGTVWIQDGNFVRPAKLRLGVTDSINTEVVSGELKEGDLLVTGEQTAAAAAANDDAKNPFAPNFGKMRGGGTGGGGGRGR